MAIKWLKTGEDAYSLRIETDGGELTLADLEYSGGLKSWIATYPKLPLMGETIRGRRDDPEIARSNVVRHVKTCVRDLVSALDL
jgi:hypothetical protein